MRGLVRCVAVTGCALLSSCAAHVPHDAHPMLATGTEPTRFAPSTPAATASASPPSTRTQEEAAAEQTVARALGFVSRVRELEALGPVKGRVISRDEMVARVERSLDTEIPSAVVSASGEILFALGAVPASFDYRRGHALSLSDRA